VRTILTAPSRNNLTYLLTLCEQVLTSFQCHSATIYTLDSARVHGFLFSTRRVCTACECFEYDIVIECLAAGRRRRWMTKNGDDNKRTLNEWMTEWLTPLYIHSWCVIAWQLTKHTIPLCVSLCDSETLTQRYTETQSDVQTDIQPRSPSPTSDESTAL